MKEAASRLLILEITPKRLLALTGPVLGGIKADAVALIFACR
jgi:hypothetical protein